jgi:predicted RNase H-like HicB family nuclease
MKFSATFLRDGEWWVGFVAELPGANTQGRTLDEARDNLREAVELVIATNRENARRAVAAQAGGDDAEIVREELQVAV